MNGGFFEGVGEIPEWFCFSYVGERTWSVFLVYDVFIY